MSFNYLPKLHFNVPLLFDGPPPFLRDNGCAINWQNLRLKAPFSRNPEDHPTQTIPSLPVLDAMISKAQTGLFNLPLKKTAIVYIHHPLLTSINLLDAIIKLGADTKSIFVLGKHYSECKYVVKKMMERGIHYQPCSMQIALGAFSDSFTQDINLLWSSVVEKIRDNEKIEEILILDHGGHALSLIPSIILEKYKVVGIEKTTAGLINFGTYGLPSFPIIGVASCAAKKFLESPLIAEAIVKKLTPLIPIEKNFLTCSVVGYGSVGQAISKKLISLGKKVIVYDNNPDQLKALKKSNAITIAEKLSDLITYSDYIFGCSGQDITAAIEFFQYTEKDKTLISCSSEDKEFLTLLRHIQKNKNNNTAINPLDNIFYKTDFGATINVVRGGFPVNFDNSNESVPANDIQLTRALVLGAVLQAIEFFKKPHLLNITGLYLLDPIVQKFVVNEWLNYQPADRFSTCETTNFQSVRWIQKNSAGMYEACHIF